MNSASSQKQLKIGIVLDALAKGGAETQAVLTTAELQKQGHDVELIVYHPHNAYEEFIQTNKLKVTCIQAKGPLRLGRLRSLTLHIHRRQFDVIYAQKLVSSVWGRLAAHLAGTPCIFGGSRGQTHPGRLSSQLNRLLSFRTSGWIANSKAGKRFLSRELSIPAHEIRIVYNGVDPVRYTSTLTREEARQEYAIPEGHLVVTIVANHSPVKNYPMFLRVAKQVCEQRDDVIFLSAGDGQLRNQLESQAREYGITHRVRFLGRINQIPNVLQASDLVVLTSHTEGLPNALLEAGGAKLPTISTDNGGAAEVIVDGKTGYLVPLDDAGAMAQKVLQLLNNPQLRQTFGQHAHQHITENFSPEVLGEKLNRIFQDALHELRSIPHEKKT